MWMEAILTTSDLQDTLQQFSPLEIRLGENGKLLLASPTRVSLTAGEGMAVVCDATLHWPVLGVNLPVHMHGLSVLVRPSVRPAPDGTCDVLAFTLQIDRAGVSILPHIIDDKVASLLNEELAKKHVELAWNFAETLTHVFSLPDALASASALALNVAGGTVRVTDHAMGFAVNFTTEVTPRIAAQERRSA
jgi:hypothetical protein